MDESTRCVRRRFSISFCGQTDGSNLPQLQCCNIWDRNHAFDTQASPSSAPALHVHPVLSPNTWSPQLSSVLTIMSADDFQASTSSRASCTIVLTPRSSKKFKSDTKSEDSSPFFHKADNNTQLKNHLPIYQITSLKKRSMRKANMKTRPRHKTQKSGCTAICINSNSPATVPVASRRRIRKKEKCLLPCSCHSGNETNLSLPLFSFREVNMLIGETHELSMESRTTVYLLAVYQSRTGWFFLSLNF